MNDFNSEFRGLCSEIEALRPEAESLRKSVDKLTYRQRIALISICVTLATLVIVVALTVAFIVESKNTIEHRRQDFIERRYEDCVAGNELRATVLKAFERIGVDLDHLASEDGLKPVDCQKP